MKILFFALIFCSLLVAQGERSNRVQFQPSALMTATIPAQVIHLDISLTSEQATQLEKARVDSTHPVKNADGTVSMRTSPTIGDQLALEIQRRILADLARAYPAPSVNAAAEAARKAQQNLEAAQQSAAEAQIKATSTTTK